jgi:two-component system, chemotaxis family, sensor kinase CheA
MSVGNELHAELLPIFREEANDRLDEIVSCLLEVEAGRAPEDATDLLFRHAHSIKGSAGMVGLTHATEVAHSLEDILEQLRSGGALPADRVEQLLGAADELRRAVSDPDAASVAIDAPAPVRSDEPAPTRSEAPTRSDAPTPVPEPVPLLRIAADKVDRMLDAVGETVLNHRRLDHMLGERDGGDDERIESEMDHGERLLSELHDAVLGMRTLPLSSITAAYPRTVRDAAKDEGVEAELVISGAETQLDRVLLDGLSETIGHLLRNAVAHGIEPADERERAGKPRRGRIELHAEPRNGLVAIELRDDGRGIAETTVARGAAEGSLVDVLATPGSPGAASGSTPSRPTSRASAGASTSPRKADREPASS